MIWIIAAYIVVWVCVALYVVPHYIEATHEDGEDATALEIIVVLFTLLAWPLVLLAAWRRQ